MVFKKCCITTRTKKNQNTFVFWFFFFGAKEDLNSTALRSRVSNQPSGLLLSARFPTRRNVYQEDYC